MLDYRREAAKNCFAMDTLARWIENETTTSEYRTVDALRHPDAITALRFWARRPPDGLRIGRDIPSRPIAKLLSGLVIYTPLADCSDARVHLAGSGLWRRFGRDITGLLMSQLLSPDDFRIRITEFREVIECGEPRLAEIIHSTAGIEVLRVDMLVLPVVAPNGTDRWIATFGFYL